MTAQASVTLQALVQDFFVQHLTIERNASRHTVAAYRDAMKLFLRYASSAAGCDPDQLDHTALDIHIVRGFLDWLQRDRQCGARTRNQRLAALKSFARYISLVAPEHLERCRLIRALPPARFEQPDVGYLTDDEIVRIIAAPDASTSAGRRDRALLLLMYNTGARVQELVELDIGDIHSGAVPIVRLFGKGRKHRCCPLWSRTIAALDRMLADRPRADADQPLLVNALGRRISRSGVTYVLRRAQARALVRPTRTARLSPHVIRHTTAMHLLQSGVDITTIAAWLGHSQLSTTHAYIEIDLLTKQAAIATESALPEIADIQYPSAHIVDWLERLAARPRYAQSMSPAGPKEGREQHPLRITDRYG
jgi:site-specific recombinase XerD